MTIRIAKVVLTEISFIFRKIEGYTPSNLGAIGRFLLTGWLADEYLATIAGQDSNIWLL